jgi:hypothetical protein
MKKEHWVVASGGKEPITYIEGKRYQYMYDKVSGRHAYYCFEDDLFLIDGLEYMLPRSIRPMFNR